MPIPDYQTAMRPVLQELSDGSVHHRKDVMENVTAHFHLTPDELREMLPSGKAPVIRSRIAWAIAYLKQAQLLRSPKRGQYQITDRGRQVLSSPPGRIDNQFLMQFPEFMEFKSRGRSAGRNQSPGPADPQGPESPQTPEEELEAAYVRLRSDVEAEILEAITDASPAFFERLVVEVLVAMGYGGSRQDAGSAVGQSGDGGIDGIIKEDRLGLDTIYLQAKRWEGIVGRPEIQKFAGALQGHRAKKGVFLTTSGFTKEAIAFVETIDSKIVLIDGDRLVSLMYDFGVGVARTTSYDVKAIDADYFAE